MAFPRAPGDSRGKRDEPIPEIAPHPIPRPTRERDIAEKVKKALEKDRERAERIAEEPESHRRRREALAMGDGDERTWPVEREPVPYRRAGRRWTRPALATILLAGLLLVAGGYVQRTYCVGEEGAAVEGDWGVNALLPYVKASSKEWCITRYATSVALARVGLAHAGKPTLAGLFEHQADVAGDAGYYRLATGHELWAAQAALYDAAAVLPDPDADEWSAALANTRRKLESIDLALWEASDDGRRLLRSFDRYAEASGRLERVKEQGKSADERGGLRREVRRTWRAFDRRAFFLSAKVVDDPEVVDPLRYEPWAPP